MKIKYLGTAAYEGVPSLFCKCEVCQRARARGGRNIRTRSQAIINDELLMDFPPDTVWHSIQYGLDWTRISDCLITHSHSDHLYPEDVEMAGSCYTNGHRFYRFYSWKDGYDRLSSIIEKDHMEGAASVTLIEPGKSFQAGDRGQYQVLPLWANHDTASSPVIYSVSCEGKRILYAHDTGVFPENTWKGLREEGRYDLVSLDCTGCLGNGQDWRDGHMSFGTNLEMRDRMYQEGLIDNKTVIVINHFSHNSIQGYDEMRPWAEKYGILTSYDGMEIEI